VLARARAARGRNADLSKSARLDYRGRARQGPSGAVSGRGYVSHGKRAHRARNKQKSFEPACLPARKRGYAISGWIHTHIRDIPYREHCVRTVDDALADAVWLIKIAVDIGVFY